MHKQLSSMLLFIINVLLDAFLFILNLFCFVLKPVSKGD